MIGSTVEIGKQFNSWKILANPIDDRVLCICTICNNTEKMVRIVALKYNISKNCGCYLNTKKKNEKIQQNQEYIGKIIGFWQIISTDPKDLYKLVVKCTNCNNITRSIRKHELFKGMTKSCGCAAVNNREETHILRYGIKNYAQHKDYRKKFIATNLKKYGVEHHNQQNDFKIKMQQEHLKKYKCYFTQSGDFAIKSRKTMKEKYGVEYNNQREENRLRISNWRDNHPESWTSSKKEIEIASYIFSQKLTIKKLRLERKELDIFVPELNLGVEFNGLRYHSESFLQQRKANPTTYHLDKTNHFKQKGIRVIHIWEHEWRHKQGQVKSFLLSALGKNESKIGARKCNIVWSGLKEEIIKAHSLLDSTHIQGYTNSTKYVANVYHQDILVATATFGRHHRNSKEWTLSRFTTKTSYTIQGILSKISKLASKELQSDIISWADYRLSNGNGYEKAGWRFEKLLKPDYFYWAGGLSKTCIISKQSRQKKLVKTPEGMTEHEHAKLDGLVRIYDCGKMRYRYKYIKEIL